LSASISSRTVYLFNDKILHIIDSGTGQTINPPFESDNYRGLFMSGATRYVQADFLISALGPGPRVVLNPSPKARRDRIRMRNRVRAV